MIEFLILMQNLVPRRQKYLNSVRAYNEEKMYSFQAQNEGRVTILNIMNQTGNLSNYFQKLEKNINVLFV